ncbi:cell cycle checkpoint protein RAD17 [Drosophila innubila]|uniref:cell cycle checkpoint protein RAD17 n=1 Tax=Drosophila innubila TaxID=198719 RepID=UPI00148DF140|nr:cell cycle checkpoint protein RAD17 [Drosophila innubila]
MSAKKKPWVRSAFSQLNMAPKSNLEAVPVKRTRSASAAAASESKIQKKGNSTLTTTTTVVDLTLDGETEAYPAESQANGIAPTVSDNWMESFAPSTSDDLAVHPKKIDEVRNWLRHCQALRSKFPAQICLLTGPAGSGKTATLRVLAQEFGYELQEWINPIDCEEIGALGDQATGNSYMGSQLEAFKSFLLRASRYKSLLATQNKRLILVEDFPNVLLKDAASTFEELLDEYANYGKSPLVFIVADSKSRILNISYKLFTDQLKAKLRIEHITFNSIASTIMQKSMKRFGTLMQQEQHKPLYKLPTQNVMDSIVVCAQGDIRSALINLHFGSLKGAPVMATKQLNVTAPSKGRKKKATNTLKSIGRDESITMMHALGRVFNPKFNEHKNKSLLHSPEDISEAFSTEPKNFVNFIHANYLPHFLDIANVKDAVNDIGVADMLLQEYRDDSMALVGLTVAVRGCMVANVAPVSGWMPVRGPKRFTNQPQLTAAEQKLLGSTYTGISRSLYASEYSSFVKIIASKGS